MKKVLMSVLFIFSLVFAMAFDGKVKGVSINNKVKESFTKKFEGAKSVIWVNLGDYQKASFLIDGYQVDAYYNNDGELEGFGRNLQKEQLPLAVTISLKNRFNDNAGFDNLWEISNPEGTSYWVTVKAQGKTNRVQVSPDGTILKTNKVKQNAGL